MKRTVAGEEIGQIKRSQGFENLADLLRAHEELEDEEDISQIQRNVPTERRVPGAAASFGSFGSLVRPSSVLPPPAELPLPAELELVGGPDWRLRLVNDIANHKINVKYPMCDVSKMRQIEGFAKESSSLSAIFKAEHEGGPLGATGVVLKASFPLLRPESPGYERSYKDDNSLHIEALNYRIVANELVRRHWTPHVVTYIASFQCDGQSLKGATDLFFDAMFGTTPDSRESCVSKAKQLEREKESQRAGRTVASSPPLSVYCSAVVLNKLADFSQVFFLMTEKMTGQTFRQWMKTPRPLDAWKSVLFQILYTLECFNRIGFRHNDLHDANIFIEETRPDDKTLYVVDVESEDLTYVVVPTFFNVRVYDFDLSTLNCSPGSINDSYAEIVEEYKRHTRGNCVNTKLLPASEGFCKAYGICQDANPKFDAFKILSILWMYGTNTRRFSVKVPPEVMVFIGRHLNRGKGRPYNPLSVQWSFPNTVSQVIFDEDTKTYFGVGGNYVLPDRLMSPVIDMLDDVEFFNFDGGDGTTIDVDCQGKEIYHLPDLPNAPDSMFNYDDLTCQNLEDIR